jgi:endonuclease G
MAGQVKALRSFAISGNVQLQGVSMTPVDPALLADRSGYDPDFLGTGARVPLPKLSAARKADAVRVSGSQMVLDYEHFSTVQSKSRRVPIYSACNLDGGKSKKVKRSNLWRFDGRIPIKYQIIEECYGNASEGMFSRGHMTRREDPVWGTAARAKLAESDTFIVTNAAPQMQPHNSPIWLGLEDYVLKHSRRDRQQVSVITGPILAKSDPTVFEVKIPLAFFKIVAFLHPQTDALLAAAYIDSQADYVQTGANAFVFGEYKGMQVSVKAVEKRTGLTFGPLAKADVLAGASADFASSVTKLQDFYIR